ncbi:MAG: M56 family metallopeptidase [Oscillospiraceae bacterium]
MLREVLTVSALILAVLLVRAIFKNRVPKRMVYTLWLVVLVKLCLPGTLVSLPVLPAEEAAAPVQRVELPAQPLPAQQPARAVTQPQTPVQQPVSPAQEAAKPAAKPLTATQIFQIVWAGGSALLGSWLFGTWLVFTVRLHKSRRFLGRHGRMRIYISSTVKSPCLAGLVPAVYLTEDVLQTDSTELILRHELTHLRHLDHPVVVLSDGGGDCLLVEPVYLAGRDLFQARRGAGVRRGCRRRAFGRAAPCLCTGDSGAGPA